MAKKGQTMNTYQNDLQEYTVREETFNGRVYVVVPVVMMVEGVHNGSQGPLLHTAEELGKIPESWNGIPVTVGHPKINDNFVSANSPEILEEWAIGLVFNTNLANFKLKSEAWLDKTRLDSYENLRDRINNGEVIEVSVGVFSEDEIVEGSWNGESYIAVARNLRPDHLAILPNQVGACSTEDGCGIRTNSRNMKHDEKNIEVLTQLKKDGYVITALNVNESLLKLVEQVRSKVYSMDSDTEYYYVEDIHEDYVIYSKNPRDGTTKLYKQGYAKAADSSIVFVGDPIEVEKTVEYETVQTNQDTGIKRTRKNNSFKKEEVMANEKCTPCVAKKVNDLIANEATQFTEKDREWLETLEEGQLDSMVPKKVEPVTAQVTPEMAVNALREGLKGEDAFINLMPTAMQEQMRSALRLQANQKTSLIDTIIANTEEGTWTKEELAGYEIAKLEKIAKTAKIQSPVDYSVMGAGNFNTNEKFEVPPMAPAGIEFKTK